MKNIIFTLLAFVAVIGFSNKTFAQSTYKNAYVGATHTYKFDGLTAGDKYAFYVLEASSSHVNSGYPGSITGNDLGSTYYTITDNNATSDGVLSGTEITDTITWLQAGTFDLWIVLQDDEGCYNYRYLTVTVTSYDVYFNVLALGAGDDETTVTEITTTTGTDTIKNECAGFVTEDFNIEGSNTTTEGNTYVYYKVSRIGTGLSSSNWAFTPTSTTSATTPISWEYSYDASSWSSMSMGAEFTVTGATASEKNIVYIRGTVDNDDLLSSAISIGLNIDDDASASTAYEVTGNIKDVTDYPSNTATTAEDDKSVIEINPLPTIGGVTGN